MPPSHHRAMSPHMPSHHRYRAPERLIVADHLVIARFHHLSISSSRDLNMTPSHHRMIACSHYATISSSHDVTTRHLIIDADHSNVSSSHERAAARTRGSAVVARTPHSARGRGHVVLSTARCVHDPTATARATHDLGRNGTTALSAAQHSTARHGAATSSSRRPGRR